MLTTLKPWIDLLASTATVLGIVIAVVVFLLDRKRSRRDREIQVYLAATDRYIQYLIQCLEHGDAAVFEPDLIHGEINPRKTAILAILVSSMEAAYHLYHDQRTPFRQAQWEGWNQFMRLWASSNEFREYWKIAGSDFDAAFSSHINSLLDQEPKHDASETPSKVAKVNRE